MSDGSNGRCLGCNATQSYGASQGAFFLVAGYCIECAPERHSALASKHQPAAAPVSSPQEAEEEVEPLLPPGPTALAKSVRRLKSAAFNVVEARERLPQPFFWSLFYSQISDLREVKAKKRLEQKLRLYPVQPQNGDCSEN